MTMTEQPGTKELVPRRGTRLTDARTGRIGEVMDIMHNRVYLRPVGGGCEWVAKREDCRSSPVPGSVRTAAVAGGRGRDTVGAGSATGGRDRDG